jgi:hypothetical protein
VLGTSTEAAASDTELPAGCSAYLDSAGYMRLGGSNNPDNVKKLQSFLNNELGLSLPVTGVFGPLTLDAVKQFQLKYWEQILKPWVPLGLPSDHAATGYVYKTTLYQINKLSCGSLDVPAPELP